MEEIDGRLIFLILFVVISAFKWLMERIKNKGDQPHEVSESLEDVYEEFREEIRQRQTTVQQEQPTYSPPPLPQAPPPTPQRVATPQPVTFSPPKKAGLSHEQKAAAARFEQLTSHKNTHRRNTGTKGSLRSLLANRESTQQAIVLLEILGKPKSMQDA